MKRFIYLIAIMLIGLSVSAQTAFTNDTITDTGTVTTDVVRWTGDGVLTMSVLYTQLTGTAAGTATLKGSLDGVTYTTLADDTYGNFLWFSNDTDTISATNGASWIVELRGTHGMEYFYISTTGTGTQTSKVTGYYDIKR